MGLAFQLRVAVNVLKIAARPSNATCSVWLGLKALTRCLLAAREQLFSRLSHGIFLQNF